MNLPSPFTNRTHTFGNMLCRNNLLSMSNIAFPLFKLRTVGIDRLYEQFFGLDCLQLVGEFSDSSERIMFTFIRIHD
jgi:hypothetical protein